MYTDKLDANNNQVNFTIVFFYEIFALPPIIPQNNVLTKLW